MTDMTTIDYHGKPASCDLYKTGGDNVWIHHRATDTVILFGPPFHTDEAGGFADYCRALKDGAWVPGHDAGDAGEVYLCEDGDTYRHQEHDVTLTLDTRHCDIVKVAHYDDDNDAVTLTVEENRLGSAAQELLAPDIS